MIENDLQEYTLSYSKSETVVKLYLYEKNIESFESFHESVYYTVHYTESGDSVHFPIDEYSMLCKILEKKTIREQIESFFKEVKEQKEFDLTVKYRTEYSFLYDQMSTQIYDNLDDFIKVQNIIIENFHNHSENEFSENVADLEESLLEEEENY